MKTYMKGVFIVIAICFSLILLEVIFTPLGIFHTAQQTVQKVTDPNRMIYTYEKFYDLCNAIQAVEMKIKSEEQTLERNPDMSESRKNMHYTNISGLNARRADLISKYNSMSQQELTREWFKGKNLPHRIPNDVFDGTCTQCE